VIKRVIAAATILSTLGTTAILGRPPANVASGATPNGQERPFRGEEVAGKGASERAYSPFEAGVSMAQPDLKIAQFLFPPTNDKALRVHVANAGGGNAAACVLRLTVRKINGVAVGRVTEIPVPAIAAGTDIWLLIHADKILPKNVALKDTTFKLNVDATSTVVESDESNNEVWHNL
jgi:hypothetical protein